MGRSVYIFSGTGAPDYKHVLLKYDIDNRVWDELHFNGAIIGQMIPNVASVEDECLPIPRFCHALEVMGDHLVVFGGTGTEPGENENLNDISFFDTVNVSNSIDILIKSQ